MLSNLGFALIIFQQLKIHLSVLKTAMVCILFQTILKVVCFLILSQANSGPLPLLLALYVMIKNQWK